MTTSVPARAVIRTCIGCRQRVPATDLLRVVAGPAVSSDESRAVLPDPRRHAAGRGAWLHPTPGCLALAERRRAFGRSLRCGVPLDPTPLRQYVESLAES